MGRHRGSHQIYGESGASLHLKIKAYHVDIARGDTQRPGLKMDDIITMVVPRQSYLKYIDPDGTRPFEEVKAEVKTMASRFYHLVQADPTTAKHCAEVARGLISTLDVYEAFHFITRQPGWAAKDERRCLLHLRFPHDWSLVVKHQVSRRGPAGRAVPPVGVGEP